MKYVVAIFGKNDGIVDVIGFESEETAQQVAHEINKEGAYRAKVVTADEVDERGYID